MLHLYHTLLVQNQRPPCTDQLLLEQTDRGSLSLVLGYQQAAVKIAIVGIFETSVLLKLTDLSVTSCCQSEG